jgi:translation elongation factor EF-G
MLSLVTVETSPLHSKPMNYLDLWIANLRQRTSVRLAQALTVVGHREKHFGPRSEFARIVMTISPSEELEVIDNVACRKELEALGVAWPQCVVFGLLDMVLFAEFGPLYKIRITLDDAAYHEVDTSENAFREAGRDAGHNVIETARRDRLIRFGA